MLAIRMQRTGRKGHAMFRFVVQDSRRTPTSGKVVAQLGSYDPHAKTVALDKDKASFYLEHGAQPSERVARLLKSEGVDLPTWVKLNDTKTGSIRHTDKLRRNRPPEEKVAEPAAEPAEPEAAVEETAAEAPATETVEPASSEAVTTTETTSTAEPQTADETPTETAAVETPEAKSEES